jgi:hypothetical protein
MASIVTQGDLILSGVAAAAVVWIAPKIAGFDKSLASSDTRKFVGDWITIAGTIILLRMVL